MVLRLPLSEGADVRALDEADISPLYELTKTNLHHLKQWFPWAKRIWAMDETRAFVQESKRKRITNKAFDAGIFYKGQICGVIGFHEIRWQNRVVELGYWLSQSYMGNGLMSRAVQVMCLYAFRELKLNRIEIICAEHNLKSRAVAERLGFREEGRAFEGQYLNGRYVDERRYALLRQDYLTKSSILEKPLPIKRMEISPHAESAGSICSP